MNDLVFILDGDDQFVAIYVNGRKYGDIYSLDYDPSYISTWYDLIKDYRKFDVINEYSLSNSGLDKYSRGSGNQFPELLSDFNEGELYNEFNYR